ncbi:hypothetical protein M9435_006367 [Picochlorum sp. BPE23]|nr:hypothetical protein M9435_006367 [Picochlorum sp. BPE23]
MAASSGPILVVPPLECAWLTGDEYVLHDPTVDHVLLFEAKGSNDVTILLKEQYGSRRWQNDLVSRSAEHQGYTVIIGSHRNSCVKIEKNAKVEYVAGTVGCEEMQLANHVMRPFWMMYSAGEIRVGWGDNPRDPRTCFCVWKDDQPHTNIQYAGLSSWDCHVGYRNVRMLHVGRMEADVDEDTDEKPTCAMDIDSTNEICTLSDICLKRLEDTVTLASVCNILMVMDAMLDDLIMHDRLMQRCIDFVAENFEDVSSKYRHEFHRLSSRVLEKIVKHQAIPCREMVVYQAVLAWAGSDDAFISAGPRTPTKSRNEVPSYYCSYQVKEGADAVLCSVRFPLMSREELCDIQSSSLYARSQMLRNLIEEALSFHDCPMVDGTNPMDPSIRVNGVVNGKLLCHDATMRFRQRCPSGCTQLVHIYDGDTNGVCHFIGTRYGRQAWVNPVSAGLLKVVASSPPSRCGTDPKSLVSRSFSRINFAGPRRAMDGSHESWWMIDLGERHRLRCTRYILRHDGSADFLRDWCLQASVDGQEWETLVSHSNDQTLKVSGQFASWPIRYHENKKDSRFRFFRVLQTKPNFNAPNPMHVSLSQFDLYGDLHIIS